LTDSSVSDLTVTAAAARIARSVTGSNEEEREHLENAIPRQHLAKIGQLSRTRNRSKATAQRIARSVRRT